MAFRDLLLATLTYPDATPDRALRSGVALARRLGGALTLCAVRADIPALRNPIANAVLSLDALAEEEESRSAATAQLAAGCVAIAAAEAGVTAHPQPITVRLYEEGEAVAAIARTHDICLLPIGPLVAADRALAEAVLFGSGRPVLVFPEDVEVVASADLGTIAIAWDASARAARAVADALPLLRRAGTVRIFVATHEKPGALPGRAGDLVRHLAAHGVDAILDERPADGRPIGRMLSDYVRDHAVDLLVMGGFGHARLRQFILGGATSSMLESPPCPLLMSH